MKVLQMITSTLVLVLMCSPNAQSIDYSPCTYGTSSRYHNVVRCDGNVAAEVLDVFQRNKNNPNITALYLWSIDDLTDEILEEILEIVALSASRNVVEISLRFLPKVQKVPEAIQRFTSIHWFNLYSSDGIQILPSGSMVFSSNYVNEINICYNPNLEAIEPGAFQGDFSSGLIIVLRENNLKTFDGAVFNPLLSDSMVSVIVKGNPIACDCNLAWIIRDNPQYILDARVLGDCYDDNGQTVDFENVDPAILKNC